MKPLPPTPALADLSPQAQRLADLVPGVYHARDLAAGKDRALLRLLATLAEPLAELDRAINSLSDDHFVETASLEALAHLAELVGARIYRDGAPTNRSVIAHMVHWLRRKGVASTLEDVIAGSTGWSAEVEEAFRSVLMTQWINAPTLHRGRNTVTWDPIALADPLTRTAAWGAGPREAARRAETLSLIRIGDETVEQTLRRIGRADAQGVAIAPRTLDLNGWAQPHVALIRTARVEDAWVEGRDLGDARTGASPDDLGSLRRTPHRQPGLAGFVGGTLNPTGEVTRVLWDAPVDPPGHAPQLTEAHEPGPPPRGSRTAVRVLTSTELASRGPEVEASGALSVAVDGVTLVGDDLSVHPDMDDFSGVVGAPVLRLADTGRPSPADRWTLRLVALDNPVTVPATVAGAVPLGAPGDENATTLEVAAVKGSAPVPDLGPAASFDIGGAEPAIRITRGRLGRGYVRLADGSWSNASFGASTGTPLSDVAIIHGAPELRLARLERRGGAPGIAVLRPDGPAGWSFSALDLSGLAIADRPDSDAPVDGPVHALVGLPGGDLLLVGNDETESRTGIWQITDPQGTPAIARVDTVDQASPSPRPTPSVVLHDGRIFLFGGSDEAVGGAMPAPRDDLWSARLAGADAFRWRFHAMRFPRAGRADVARAAGRLLSTPSGLVLIGGASTPGILSASVMRADLSTTRPRWTEMADLPLDAAAPGALWARADGDALTALVWDDSTMPRAMVLPAGGGRWRPGLPETDGSPNPPAEGEAIFDGDRFVIVAPPPLPPSEVLFSQGAQARIVFLPAVDLTSANPMALFTATATGDSARWYDGGGAARPNFRLGGGRLADTSGRAAPARRLGAINRLAWTPLTLRQCSLAPWDNPLALDLEDAVGFDPRLGRFVVRDEIGRGRITVTYRTGRAAPIGPGFADRDASVARFWRDATAPEGLEAVTAPDDLPTVYLDPIRAGQPAPSGLFAATLAEAFSEAEQDVRVTAARRLAPATLKLAETTRNRLDGLGPQHTAQIGADAEGRSLILREALAAGSIPEDGPEVWLASIDTTGALALDLSAGRVDVSWSWLGRPGAPGLAALGAGLQSGPALTTIPEARLFVHLRGCHLGTVALPAWVHLVATGCTFDADAGDATAIAAPGARLRLRHCTIRGHTEAGMIEASSCAFAGQLTATRPDLGYLRFSVVAEGDRKPCLYHSLEAPLSLTSAIPGDPSYLMLDENNADAILSAGERGTTPGAYADRAGLISEMTARTTDFLPMGLEARHSDRSRRANFIMNRRLP